MSRERRNSNSDLMPVLLRLYLPVMFGSLVIPAFIGFLVGLISRTTWVVCLVPVLLVLLCGLHVAGLAWVSMQKERRDRDWFEMELDPGLKVKLRDFVQEIARRWDTPQPDDIRLSAGSAAHVYETGKGKRILVVGGVALAALSRAGLGAIIAHELSHFAGGDTGFAWENLSGFRMMNRLGWEFRNRLYHFVNPAVWPTAAYQFFVESCYAKMSRAREYRCDARAARHAGKEVTAAALVYLHVVENMPWANIRNVLALAATVGPASGEVFTEQARRAMEAHPDDWAEATDKELQKRTGLFDSHPCLRERLDAIGASARQGLAYLLADESPPARTLIKDWRSIERKLSVKLTSLFQLERENRYVGGLD